MKNRGFIESFTNAMNGIFYAIKSEKNMRIHAVAAIAVAIMSLFFDLSATEIALLVVAVIMVIVCEMFNTAIEIVVDIIVDVYHPKAKNAKDVAAGAVLVSAFGSVIVGYSIFFNRLEPAANILLYRILSSPMHITFVCLIMTCILFFGVKTFVASRFRGLFEVLTTLMLVVLALLMAFQLFFLK